ncbi:MAG: PilZ domain-containing protein [Candidatus Omnitrophota bacterium]
MGQEKRRYARVEQRIVLHVRRPIPLGQIEKWEAAVVYDISATGLAFYSAHHYEAGTALEIVIENPHHTTRSTIDGAVVRCDPSTRMKGFNRIAISIKKITTNEKDFLESIDFFVTRAERKRDV